MTAGLPRRSKHTKRALFKHPLMQSFGWCGLRSRITGQRSTPMRSYEVSCANEALQHSSTHTWEVCERVVNVTVKVNNLLVISI